MRIEVVTNDDDLSRRAADIVCRIVREAPLATIALPSGKTPLGTYGELAQRVAAANVDLTGVTAFAIDELHGIPRDHPATNASYFKRQLGKGILLKSLHVMDSESPDAEAECGRFWALIAGAGVLELAVLGIGVNGHLAFNEPRSPFDSAARRVTLEKSTREPYIQAFGSFEATPAFGLTLGIADLNAARRLLLLASGASKAKAVASALEGPVTEGVPASMLQRHPDVAVVLDREAASLLTRRYSAE